MCAIRKTCSRTWRYFLSEERSVERDREESLGMHIHHPWPIFALLWNLSFSHDQLRIDPCRVKDANDAVNHPVLDNSREPIDSSCASSDEDNILRWSSKTCHSHEPLSSNSKSVAKELGCRRSDSSWQQDFLFFDSVPFLSRRIDNTWKRRKFSCSVRDKRARTLILRCPLYVSVGFSSIVFPCLVFLSFAASLFPPVSTSQSRPREDSERTK